MEVPAFLGIVNEIHLKPFVKVFSIYPRNVLLADQLREALSESFKISETLTDFVVKGTKPTPAPASQDLPF